MSATSVPTTANLPTSPKPPTPANAPPPRPSAAPLRAFASVLAIAGPKPKIALTSPLVRFPTKAPSPGVGQHAPPAEGRVHKREKHEHEHDDEKKKERPLATFDPLDPTSRRVAQIGPPIAIGPPAPPTNEVATRARVSMEDLLPQLVRRIAWAGDRRRGSVQLEIGTGRHEGTTVTVHADDGRVRVELRGKDEAAIDDLRQRLDARLRRHGLDVDSVS